MADDNSDEDKWSKFVFYIVRVEVYIFSWILWYTSYPQKLIHNN